jgi:hypothetical protein
MILYHGTSEKFLDNILREGLSPRLSRKSHWKAHPSAKDRVYLTNAYAVYFATAVAEKGERGVVLQVDVDVSKLVADEDALAQCKIVDEDLQHLNAMNLKERTKFWKKQAPRYPELAQISLERLGNVAHMGVIPPAQIVKFVTFDIVPEIVFGHDPTISVLNFTLLGNCYKKALREFVESDGKEGRVVRSSDALWDQIK